jgi:hypothetical protein
MESKENNKSCDEEMGSAEDAGNPEGGKEGNPVSQSAGEGNKEGNPVSQSAGEGNPGLQPGPVPGQMPFPYGYFQSPNLHPGYYMAQGGFPQGQMPGYWMPPGYGNFPPYMYMQPGSAAPQGTGQAGGWSDPGNPGSQQPQGQPGGVAQSANPGTPGMQDPAGGAGAQDNPGQFQQHDAPGDAGGPDNASYAPDDNAGGQGAAPGHYKEPGHDELKYGTYMEKPDHVGPGHAPEMAEDVSAPSGLTSFFQFDNDSFWKGILVGSLATLLLTNSTVKKGIMKTIIKASASVKGGIEELKEQLSDVEAEVLHDINETKK